MKKTIVLLIISFFVVQLGAMDDQKSDKSKPYVVNIEPIYGSTCYVIYSDGTKRFEVRSGDYICPLDKFLNDRIEATKGSITKKD